MTGVAVAPGPPAAIRARPNPFSAAVELRVDAPGAATVAIHDVRGRRIRTLEAGPALAWDGRTDDGRDVPAGVYWVRVETASSVVTRAVTRVR